MLSDDEPRTLAERAYRALREDILWGHLAPGIPLRSDVLRRDYALGISPLREALTRLVADGLVTAIGQRGFRVAPIVAAEVEEVTRLRILIDGDALRLSIARGGTEWEARVLATLHRLVRAPVPRAPGAEAEAWSRAHHEFHRTLVDGSGSAWSARLSELLYYQAERYRILHARDAPHSRRDTGAEHRDIVEAALAHDIDRAVTALGRHFQRTADAVLTALAPRQPSQPEISHERHV